MTRRSVFFCAVMVLVLALALAGAPRVTADDGNRLKELKVQVWPEYDKASVLVLLDGTLADASNLPRDVSVLIPSTATGIIATYENSDSSLAPEQSYKSEKQNDGFTQITYSTKSAAWHVEYYDDLIKGSPDKAMDFSFQASAPADQLTLEIQQPLKATNFAVTPAAMSTRNDGSFTYYDSALSNVAAGQRITAQVKYTKSDPNPSVVAVPTTAPVPATSSSPAPSSSWNSAFTIVAIIILAAAAMLGVYVYQQRSRRVEPVAVAVRRRKKGARRAPATGGSAFCTQCGSQMGAGDEFCRKCGARRRAA